jgi:transcriptional regulator with XRE-family HTH domain
MEQDYHFKNDLLLLRELLHLSQSDLARSLSLERETIARWETGETTPNHAVLDSVYSFAYDRGIRLNGVKGQFYEEENPHVKILYHGSKEGIEGILSNSKSRPSKDFGSGFYCGESSTQATSFVAMMPLASLYILSFDGTGLRHSIFHVDREWMLAISYFRGQLKGKENSPVLQQIIQKVNQADYLIVPVADNRMFEIIAQFIDGAITDVQCQHALSATNLGNQYVLRSEKALSQAKILEHCFLSSNEKKESLALRQESTRQGIEKAATARIEYKGEGSYLQEILP